MRAIFFKEINAFFSGIIGYLVMGVFLLINGLFLWVFQGQYNIFNYGFANLSGFFQLSPWVFLFLIPAVCMRSFSEERKQGTLELLLTKPLKKWDLVLGKYLGCLAVIILSIVPSLLYVLTISQLGDPPGNFDSGVLLGSYLGLVFLGAVYTAIGIFASTFSKNQIVGFISAVLLCFLCFFAFKGLSDFNLLGSHIYALEYLGISFHYESISRGVIDTRDVIYFLSLIILFLSLTKMNLKTSAR